MRIYFSKRSPVLTKRTELNKMFITRHWAAAFINSLATQGGDAEEGLIALDTLASWARSLPGAVFGRSAAEKLEKLVREGMKKTEDTSPAMETALRFLVLMVRRNAIRHIDQVIEDLKKILDRKNNIVQVTAEYAFPPGEAETRIKEAVKKRTGAVKVEITGRVNPDLIGGYRLRIGDETIDASVRSQLKKLETCLAAGTRLAGDGGN